MVINQFYGYQFYDESCTMQCKCSTENMISFGLYMSTKIRLNFARENVNTLSFFKKSTNKIFFVYSKKHIIIKGYHIISYDISHKVLNKKKECRLEKKKEEEANITVYVHERRLTIKKNFFKKRGSGYIVADIRQFLLL